MKVTCELGVGNDVDQPDACIKFINEDITRKSGFVYLSVKGELYEVRPNDIMYALERTRSDE